LTFSYASRRETHERNS
jgi:hypothetical protein